MEIKSLKLLDNIWYLLLLSYLLDLFIPRSTLQESLLQNSAAYTSTTLLALSLLLTYPQIFRSISLRIRETQTRLLLSNRKIHNVGISLLLLLLLSLKLLPGLASFNYMPAIFFIIVFGLAAFHTIREKQKHDHLMRTDPLYHHRNEQIQRLVLGILPAFFARLAGLISVQLLPAPGMELIAGIQYFLSVCLFLQARPKPDEEKRYLNHIHQESPARLRRL